MNEKTFYLTTPLYYVNDVPHIGHAYTTIAADVLARWKRLSGEPVFFMTGTDEHGTKIEKAAEAAGETPLEYADRIVSSFKKLWTTLNITYDDFIRTTEPAHQRVAQAVFQRLEKAGDIYKGTYEDWYCVPCETFLTESELNEGRCPNCGRKVDKLKEDSYFFRLSRFEKQLLAYYEKHPDFLQPRNRSSEIINFVKSGLRDLSVSRSKVSWGIQVPDHKEHTIYVWFEALQNYISGPGYASFRQAGAGKGTPLDVGFSDLWPADVHFVGKEIFRFHAVIWPAMLMALGLPLPHKVFAHGWWTVEGEKMSKSLGNVVDPHTVAEEFGVDALRYFVLREVPFGGDGDFSQKSLLNRYNGELANALGNLLNRTLNLLEKNNESKIPDLVPKSLFLPDQLTAWLEKYDATINRMAFHEALQQIMELVSACNKFMDDNAPWKTAKTDLPTALQTLYEVARTLKWIAVMISPFMPTIAENMWTQLGETEPLEKSASKILSEKKVGFLSGQTVQKGAPLFPRKEAPQK